MELIIASLLAIVQGVTEFLPVSSSAHLILPAQLWDISDQGLMFDTAVHGGTLLAVMTYFRKDIQQMFISCIPGWKYKELATERNTVLLILVASIPVLVCGYLFYGFVSNELRNIRVISATSIIFGILLWWASRGNKNKRKPDAIIILLCGISQILALVPGVSRSGITITCALANGYDPQSAARLSFLLSIPVISAAFFYGIWKLINEESGGDLIIALWGAFLAAVFAYLTIGVFLNLLSRVGIFPFVIYRILLGVGLIIFIL